MASSVIAMLHADDGYSTGCGK